ncbi:hypothetical protein V8E53_010451 [Lactarius tabidus]|jgi:hypothetical protein
MYSVHVFLASFSYATVVKSAVWVPFLRHGTFFRSTTVKMSVKTRLGTWQVPHQIPITTIDELETYPIFGCCVCSFELQISTVATVAIQLRGIFTATLAPYNVYCVLLLWTCSLREARVIASSPFRIIHLQPGDQMRRGGQTDPWTDHGFMAVLMTSLIVRLGSRFR